MTTPTKFQNSEFYSEQSHCGSPAATRRMLNLSVALVLGFGLVAGSMAMSRAQDASTPAAKPASAVAIYGGLQPLTASNCDGPSCDVMRDGLRAGHEIAGSPTTVPATVN